MNNPFANFDLEESLAGLPNTLRQPMVLAVAASTLVHGLGFLVLPVVTSSAESKKMPDRIVGVVELTPEQQSKLPPSMLVSQFPASGVPLLPLTPGGKIPLTGLFPGMPNNNIGTPAGKDPRDAWIADITRTDYGLGAPMGSNYPLRSNSASTDDFSGTKDKRIADLERELAVKKKAEDDKKAADQKAANEKQNPIDPKTGLPVLEAAKPTDVGAPPPGTLKTLPSGAADLKNPTPAQVAQQELRVATTYVGEGTKKEQETAQTELPGKLLAQLEPELNKLPEDLRNAIVGKIAFSGLANAPIELREFPAQAAALPTGIAAFNFDKTQPLAQVEAIVQVYFTPEGKLLGRPTIVRSSGIPMLNELAIQMVEKAAADKPEKLDYQAIRFRIPYILPKPANA